MFSWRMSPSSVHGVCFLQVLMACIAFKFSWRVSFLGLHGVCCLQIRLHGVTSLSSSSRRVCCPCVCVSFPRVLSSLVFGVCHLPSLFSRPSSSSSLFLWGVWLQRRFNIHGMCCFISFRGVFRVGFYCASCCMVCVFSELCSS